MTLTELPGATFQEADPDVLKRYVGGPVRGTTSERGRNAVKMAESMREWWLSAYSRRPEWFEELTVRVGLRDGAEQRLPKHDAAIASSFRRQAGGDDVTVAEKLFGVDRRVAELFELDSPAAFVTMLAYSTADIEILRSLRDYVGKGLTAPWPSAHSMKNYRDAPLERRLAYTVTKSQQAYPLMRAGVPVVSIAALTSGEITRRFGRDEVYNTIAEASFLGVPPTYAVPAILAGLTSADDVAAGYAQGVEPEYLSAVFVA